MPDSKPSMTDLLVCTSEIVSAICAAGNCEKSEVSACIRETFDALASVCATSSGAVGRPTPAVALEDSVTDDYIVCLEDGKKLKMLKRHLMTAFNMTPEEYRKRWNLKPEYPMTAPNYAKRRSSLAKNIGLGRSRPERARKAKSNAGAAKTSVAA